jgi:hypothetical protein
MSAQLDQSSNRICRMRLISAGFTGGFAEVPPVEVASCAVPADVGRIESGDVARTVLWLTRLKIHAQVCVSAQPVLSGQYWLVAICVYVSDGLFVNVLVVVVCIGSPLALTAVRTATVGNATPRRSTLVLRDHGVYGRLMTWLDVQGTPLAMAAASAPTAAVWSQYTDVVRASRLLDDTPFKALRWTEVLNGNPM